MTAIDESNDTCTVTEYYYTTLWQVVAAQASEDTVATTVRLWGQDRNQRQRGVQWQFSIADSRRSALYFWPVNKMIG